jgi:hypothetical protein
MSEAQGDELGGRVDLVAEAVLGLLRRRPVIGEAVSLHDQLLSRPVEVDLEPVHDGPRFGHRQPGQADDAEKPPLELRTGEPERAPVERLAQLGDPGPAPELLEGHPEGLGVDQPIPVSSADGSLELRGR